VFSISFGMNNSNPSTFLGTVHWKLAKQLKSNDSYSIYHSTTVTANLFEILEMLPVQYSVFPQFQYGQSKSINIFRQQ